MSAKKRVLLFGGGGVHDHKTICPVLKGYLECDDRYVIDHVTEDYDVLLASRLEGYDLLVMYHTGKTLTTEQASGMTGAVAAGMGFVGIHGAADSFKTSPEYIAMIGGVFKGHPFTRDYLISLCDPTFGIVAVHDHPILEKFEGYVVKDWEKWPVFEYMVTDEQYLLDYDPRNRILATALFKGVAQPVAWARQWGKGRVFYSAVGHHLQAIESYFFTTIFKGGAAWATRPDEEEATK